MKNRSRAIRAFAKELRDECDHDYVGLWQIAKSTFARDLTFHAMIDFILAVAAALLAEGDITLGQFTGSIFRPWPGDSTVKLTRLRREVEQLGRVPDIGEIAWFARVP
jgi:hypothetical protein